MGFRRKKSIFSNRLAARAYHMNMSFFKCFCIHQKQYDIFKRSSSVLERFVFKYLYPPYFVFNHKPIVITLLYYYSALTSSRIIYSSLSFFIQSFFFFSLIRLSFIPSSYNVLTTREKDNS